MPTRRRLSARRATEPLSVDEAFGLALELDPPTLERLNAPHSSALNLRDQVELYQRDRTQVLLWWRGFVARAWEPMPPYAFKGQDDLERRARLRGLALPVAALHADFGGRQPRSRATIVRYLEQYGLALPAACAIPETLSFSTPEPVAVDDDERLVGNRGRTHAEA